MKKLFTVISILLFAAPAFAQKLQIYCASPTQNVLITGIIWTQGTLPSGDRQGLAELAVDIGMSPTEYQKYEGSYIETFCVKGCGKPRFVKFFDLRYRIKGNDGKYTTKAQFELELRSKWGRYRNSGGLDEEVICDVRKVES